jgi:Tol biopolymer transport system component
MYGKAQYTTGGNSMKSSKTLSIVLSLSCFSFLFGCSQSGSSILKNTDTGEQTLTFGELSVRAATTNPPVVSVLNGSSVRGLTGQIKGLEVNNFSKSLASTKIAFVSQRDGDAEVFVMNADGSHQTRLTDNIFFDNSPTWSPDGTKIAFATNRDGNFEIYTMNANGSSQTRITNNTAGDITPSWSPDGTKIAFVSDRDGNPEIYTMSPNGANLTRLTTNASKEQALAWSPDGTKIAFATDRDGNFEIYTMNANGSSQTRITNNAGTDITPSWSPDGTRIAFVSERDGNPEIYTMNANGSSQTRLTNNTFPDANPTWSPDGNLIAFVTPITGNHEVYTMNADGSNQTRITNNIANEFATAWSPFFSRIVLVGDIGTLSTAATGFLYATENQRPASAVAWSNADFSALQLKSLTPQNGNGDVMSFIVEGATNATDFTSLKFWNFAQASPVTIPTTGINGALIDIGGFNGQVQNIITFTTPNRSAGKPTLKTENGKTLIKGTLVGVWDKSGHNLAPQGATQVTLDSRTGNILRVE